VPTLRISVSGERQNLFGDLKILPGIGSLEKLFGKLQITLAHYIIYLGLASNFVLISGDVSFCLSMVDCKLYNEFNPLAKNDPLYYVGKISSKY